MMQASKRSFAFAVLWCLVHLCWTLTPPRIIYGGWTPIVPGHPFYFGPTRQQQSHYQQAHYEPEHQVEYVSPDHYQTYEKPRAGLGHFQSYENPGGSPVHFQSYEKPSGSPIQFQSYEKPSSGPVHLHSYEKPSGSPPQYHSYDKPDVGPVQYQAYEKPKDIDHQVEYVSPLKYQTYKPESSPVKPQSYDKPNAEHYAKYVSQVQHQSLKPHNEPVKYQTYDQPKDVYHPPQYHDQQEHITYGHKAGKDIFSYYPPQSAYEGPKGHGYGQKPIYFEDANKALHMFHGAQLTSLKDFPIDLKSIYPVGGKALKVKPLNLDALKHIGHLNAGQLHHLGKYPVVMDSSGGIPIKPALLSLGYKSYAPVHAPYTVSHSPNTYNGGAVGPNGFLQLKRPLNPIETKYIRSTAQLHGPIPKQRLRVPRVRGYRPLHLPVLHPSMAYSTLGPMPFVRPRALQRPVVVGNPSLKNYASAKALSYHPAYQGGQPSSNLLLSDYLHKDVKLHSLYKNPAVVANIHGSPALVEREVAIVHVPVEEAKAYHQDSEHLYHTASTPESTQVLDSARVSRGLPGKQLPGLGSNESYTQITLDYGKGVEHVTLVEPAADGGHQSGSPPPGHGSDQYIFVSSDGVHGTDVLHNGVEHQGQAEVKKQFFHAYYAPRDHSPPPGYVRMTVPEFNRLFSSAEIRYVDKRGDLESQSSAKKEHRTPAEKKS